MNQEDIEAVQFLASEFSKEAQTLRNVEQKDTVDIETVDSTMLEVASVQGVSEQNLPPTQRLVIDEASVTCQVFNALSYMQPHPISLAFLK